MSETTKYLAAAISPNMPWNCRTKKDVVANLERLVERIESYLLANLSYLPIKLFVFPEDQFNPADLAYWYVRPLREQAEAIGVEIPGKETDMLTRACKKHDIYLVAGSALEVDPKYPGIFFNTSAVIGPEGVLIKYRKVNPFIPRETCVSPADLLPEYDEELWPVAKTPIGNLGVAICYDWIFPESLRSLTLNGAEILIRPSAYPQPWGGTPPMDWWTVVNRCRAIENVAYVVAANVGTTTEVMNMPGVTWAGQPQIIDWDGRIIAQAAPGPGERVALGPIDIDMLRWVRQTQVQHNIPCQLRTEAYPCYRNTYYPTGLGTERFSGTMPEVTERLTATIKQSMKKLWERA
jgi:formamidase